MIAPTVSSCEMRGRRAPVGPVGLLVLFSVLANGLITPGALAPAGGVGVALLLDAPVADTLRVCAAEFDAVPGGDPAGSGAVFASSGGVPAPPERGLDMENLSYFSKATDEIV